jgi:DNA-binding response OmpR family regulator
MNKKPIRKKTILVIEDELPLLRVVNTKLEKSGFKVIAARSVDQVFSAGLEKKSEKNITIETINQALSYLGDLKNVDAIWLDHNLLGKENGLDLVVRLRTNGAKWTKIPIFVVSNSENPATVRSYLDLGKSKYYVKSNHRLDAIIDDIKDFFVDTKIKPKTSSHH